MAAAAEVVVVVAAAAAVHMIDHLVAVGNNNRLIFEGDYIFKY
jgi:hypothetical protein